MTDQTILTQADFTDYLDHDGHEKIVHLEDSATGLDAYIAVHNSHLGPALGGCRMIAYPTAADALRDALRLSRGMTYKNALAGLPLGGGKSVIIGDPYKHKTDALMRAFGRGVESLGGLYVTAEDSGSNEHDMEVIATETRYVVGIPDKTGIGGNPSPVTAWGVYCGIKAAAQRRFKTDDLRGLTVSVQGLGSVGYDLCRLLDKDGVQLIATGIRAAVLAQAQAEFKTINIVEADEIFDVQADIFAPCALGAQLNDATIPQLNVKIVAGAANNQLARPQHEQMLADRDILYVPDYVVNAGGVTAVGYEYFLRSGNNPYNFTLTRDAMLAHVGKIGDTVTRIFDLADTQGLTPGVAADRLAESIFRGPATPAKRASGG